MPLAGVRALRGALQSIGQMEREPFPLLTAVAAATLPCCLPLSEAVLCFSAGAQVVERISLPYLATSLSLAPAARLMAIGSGGE